MCRALAQRGRAQGNRHEHHHWLLSGFVGVYWGKKKGVAQRVSFDVAPLRHQGIEPATDPRPFFRAAAR